MTSHGSPPEKESGSLSMLSRWSLAGALVLALHGAAAFALAMRQPEPAPPEGAPEAAILIDLEPPAESAEAPPPPELAEEAPVEEVALEPEPELEPTVPDDNEPPPPEVLEPEIAEPRPEPPEPELVEEPMPEPEVAPPAAIPLPSMRPSPPRPKVEPAPRRVVERQRPPKQAKPPERRQPSPRAPASTLSRGDPNRTVSQGARVSASELNRWQGRLQARVNRAKRSVRSSGTGTASIAFMVQSNGSITGTRVVRSSGNAAVDQAALQLVARGAPYPPHPSGNATNITVPIRVE